MALRGNGTGDVGRRGARSNTLRRDGEENH